MKSLYKICCLDVQQNYERTRLLSYLVWKQAERMKTNRNRIFGNTSELEISWRHALFLKINLHAGFLPLAKKRTLDVTNYAICVCCTCKTSCQLPSASLCEFSGVSVLWPLSAGFALFFAAFGSGLDLLSNPTAEPAVLPQDACWSIDPGCPVPRWVACRLSCTIVLGFGESFAREYRISSTAEFRISIFWISACQCLTKLLSSREAPRERLSSSIGRNYLHKVYRLEQKLLLTEPVDGTSVIMTLLI